MSSFSLDTVDSGTYRKFTDLLTIRKSQIKKKMEENSMKVSYKDYTGELVKLEKNIRPLPFGEPNYSLTIRMESGETVQFEGVQISKLRFCGGQVSFSE